MCVSYGGLALCTAADLALPTFLSSHAASNNLVSDILHQPNNMPEDDDEVLALRDRSLDLPSDIQCSSASALVLVINQHLLACFRTALRPESWLSCVHNSIVRAFIYKDTPYRLRSPRRTLCLYSSSMQLRDNGRPVRHAPFAVPCQRKAHTSPFCHYICRSTRSFYTRDAYRPCVLTAETESGKMEYLCTNTHTAPVSSLTQRASANLIRTTLAAVSITDTVVVTAGT